jgi:hypothetical protein
MRAMAASRSESPGQVGVPAPCQTPITNDGEGAATPQPGLADAELSESAGLVTSEGTISPLLP